jgi:multidrug efflux pump subunit AcrA (membrane-fusion protein)
LAFEVRTLAAGALAQIPTILTLGLLGGIAVWGAQNDWKFSQRKKETATETEEQRSTVKVVGDDSSSSSAEGKQSLVSRLSQRIEFPSKEAVYVAGIQDVAVEIRAMAHYVTANGMLDYEPYRYTQLSARAPGTIWHVNKVMGEAVHKGDVLALIESAEVGRAKADFLQSLALFDVRTRALERLRTAGGAVAGGTLREAEDSLREARIRRFNDHQRLLNLGLALRIEDVNMLPVEEQIDRLRLWGLPDSVRNQPDAETLTANLLPLVAPFDGTVVRHPQAARGEVVSTTKPLFVIGDTSHLHIDLEVHLEDVAHLRLGQEVTFLPEDNSRKEAKGTLAHISPEVNEKTRHVQVHAEVENPDWRLALPTYLFAQGAGAQGSKLVGAPLGSIAHIVVGLGAAESDAFAGRRLRPNTFGTGRILINRKPSALAVPNEALQEIVEFGIGHSFVFVRTSETTFQTRRVTRRLRDGAFTEVEGIGPGDKVVTAGSHVLKSELFKDLMAGSED